MAKLNLNIKIIDELGNHIHHDRTIGSSIAGFLRLSITKVESDISKYFEWSGTLGQNKDLELDKADAKNLKKFIVNHHEMSTIVKSPAIDEIDRLKFD